LRAGTWLILCDQTQGPVGDALARDFSARGSETLVHDCSLPFAADALEALLGQRETDIAGAIVLLSDRPYGSGEARLNDLARLCEIIERERGKEPIRVIVATSNGASVFGEAVADHRTAIEIGGVLVLRREYPELGLRQVDIDLTES